MKLYKAYHPIDNTNEIFPTVDHYDEDERMHEHEDMLAAEDWTEPRRRSRAEMKREIDRLKYVNRK